MTIKTPEKGDVLTYTGRVAKKPASNSKSVRITLEAQNNRKSMQAYVTVPVDLVRMVERAPPAKGDTVINPADKSEMVLMTNAAGGCVLAQSKDPSVGIIMLKPENKWSSWTIKERVGGSYQAGDVVEFDATFGTDQFPSGYGTCSYGFFVPVEKIMTKDYYGNGESSAALRVSAATKIAPRPHALGDTIIDPADKSSVVILTNPAAGCVLVQSIDPSVGVRMLKPENKWTSWARVGK